jgi:hypothetical protein
MPTTTNKSCSRTISKRSWPRRPEYTLDGGARKGELPVTDNISREELKAKIDRGDKFVLVDALSAKHYESSHLPGSINLPYEFVDEAESLLPDKEADISFPKHKSSELEVPRLSDRERHRARINEGLSHY